MVTSHTPDVIVIVIGKVILSWLQRRTPDVIVIVIGKVILSWLQATRLT